MRFKVILFSILISTTAFAQYKWDFGGGMGPSNYLGDMGGKEKTRRNFLYDMKLAKTRFDMGGFARYKFNRRFAVKAELAYLQIAGDDALSSNTGRHARNLSFKNNIFELSVKPEITYYENNDLGSSYRFRLGFKAYAFAGVGVFHHQPKAFYKDEWVKLQPLHTEGVNYKLWQVAIPVGTGFYFTMKKKHRIGFEASYRVTFTDYLDDVSTVYPKGLTGEALALSNRTGELGNAVKPDVKGFFTPGHKRGDPSHKDAYMTLFLNYSYVLRGKSNFYRSRYGSFFFKKTRRKVRKIRAKF
ncbi:MAG: DUF6089 family protein [Bacteroidia bacterium]